MTYIDRLEEELFSLSDKLQKLSRFVISSPWDQLSHREQVKLDEQYAVMKRYEDILTERITLAKENK